MDATGLLLENVFRYDYDNPSPLVVGRLCPDLEGLEDEKLLQLVKTGINRRQRDGAFGVLYNRYYLDVWRFVKSRVGVVEQAQDVFLEVWLVAVKGLRDFEGGVSR